MARLGFIFSFFGILNIPGLILSVIAFRRARRNGERRGLALAGIIISAVGILFLALSIFMVVGATTNISQECGNFGPGVHHVGSVIYSCS